MSGGGGGGGWPHAAAGISGGRNYADLRDFGGVAGANISTSFAAALLVLAVTGGVLFIPPSATASTINTAQTIPANVWIWGTGWNEGGPGVGVQQGSTIAAGAAMTALFTMGQGSGLAFLNITDPAPFCTVTLVDTSSAASVKIIECAVRGGNMVGLPVVTIGSPGGRCRITGGRIVNNDTSSASSKALLLSGSSSDHFIGGGLTLDARLALSQQGGSNIQYNFVHATGGGGVGVNSTSNITVTGGQATFTNVQTDACPGGASVNIIPGAAAMVHVQFVGGRILNNQQNTANPCFILDCTAANSIGSLVIDGMDAFCDVANPAQAIVRILGTNTAVSIMGGSWLGVSAVWDAANVAPNVAIPGVMLTGSPNPTTIDAPVDIVGRRQARITSTSSKNSTTFSNVNGAGFNIEANAIYRFRFVIFVDGPTAGDVKFQLNGPAAPTLITYGIHGGDAATPTSFTNPTLQAFANGGTAAGLPVGLLGAGTIQMVILEGLCQNGANAGTIQLQAGQVAASGTTVIDLGTFVEADRMRA